MTPLPLKATSFVKEKRAPMKNELRARIFEMTLAAFGASACAHTAQATDPSKVPAAAEVTKPSAAGHGEASCSAAGCGAQADDTAASGAKTAASDTRAAETNAPAMAAEPASPPMAAKTETAAAVTQKAETASDGPAAAAPPKAKPRSKHVKKKSADDEGCGAGSCASAK